MNDTSYLISCDWGTSAFRLRLLHGRESPKIIADRVTARGILTLPARDAEEFQNYLVLELDRLFRAAKLSPEPVPVFLSGMISSTLGWRELPYAELPFPLDGSTVVAERTQLRRVYGTHDLVFISGARTDDDVLRGEETELTGIFQDPRVRSYGRSSLVLLPGTHSKALQVQGNALVGFRTYLTGELYEILRQQSILRHSVAADPSQDEGALEFFDRGVRQAASAGLLESLFSVRTNVILKGIPQDFNTRYLSGLVIGTEVASILAKFPPPRPILLGGSASLQALYKRAFGALGFSARVHTVPEEVSAVAVSLGHWRLRAALEYDPLRTPSVKHGNAEA